MGRLRYSINITLDGCCDHEAGMPDAESHAFWADVVAEAGALLYGTTTYCMMEGAWRPVAEAGIQPEGMADWVVPFAHSIHKARKYVVSNSLQSVDWNAELVSGDLKRSIERIKQETDGVISLGGVKLPLSLARLDLIDEYQFVIQPRIAGHGPTLLSGLPERLDLRLMDRKEFRSGSIVALYEARH